MFCVVCGGGGGGGGGWGYGWVEGCAVFCRWPEWLREERQSLGRMLCENMNVYLPVITQHNEQERPARLGGGALLDLMLQPDGAQIGCY